MIERLKDKQLKILQSICNPDNLGNDHGTLVNYTLEMTPNDLESIAHYFESRGLIQIIGNSQVPFTNKYGEEVDSDDIYITYHVQNLEKLQGLLAGLNSLYLPKRNKPIIRLKALELIARKFADLDSGTGLVKFLKDNGVDSELIIYPNTKWKMVYDIFEYMALSAKKEDNDLIFTLLEEISHPLALGGDRDRALEIQDFFSTCLQYDGYCMDKGIVVEATAEIIENVEQRGEERKARTALSFSKLADSSLLAGFFDVAPFGSRTQPRKIKTEPKTPPVQVHIYNTNTQNNNPTHTNTEKLPTTRFMLKDKEVSFDDDSGLLNIGDKPVALPPYKNEHLFCRVIFKRKKKEPVDWSVIYQEMTGKNEPEDQEKNQRTVRDTMYALNNRIKEVLNTEDDLFNWSERTITRMY